MSTDADIIAFIRARLAEDKAIAEDAARVGGGRWTTGDDEDSGYPNSPCVLDEQGEIVVYDEGRPRWTEARHIAHYDPERALRGVKAKRRIVNELERSLGLDPEYAAVATSVAWLSWCVRQHISEWVTHPDFRPEWTL